MICVGTIHNGWTSKDDNLIHVLNHDTGDPFANYEEMVLANPSPQCVAENVLNVALMATINTGDKQRCDEALDPSLV